MNSTFTIARREFANYFNTPIGAIYLAIFAAISVFSALQIGQMIEYNEASLYIYFQFMPYIFAFLIPALSMRIYAEGNKSGITQSLFALPITDSDIIIGKFIGAFFVIIIGIALSLPLWIAVNFLGAVDNMVAFGGYIATILLAAVILMISMAVGVFSENQIIAYIAGVLVSLLPIIIGAPILTDVLPNGAIFANLSITDSYDTLIRGRFGLGDIGLFIGYLALGYALNLIFLKSKRAAAI